MEKVRWILVFSVTVLIMSSPCYAEEWAITYGAPGNLGLDGAQCVQQTVDGGYVVAGWAALGWDIWVLKLNPDGSIAWQKAFVGTGTDNALAIQQTFDEFEQPDGYVVVGYTTSFGGPDCDMWVLKLDLSGDPVWQNTYGGEYDDRARSVRQTADRGYIVAGESANDIWVLKLRPDGQPNSGDYGVVEWQKTYGVSAGIEIETAHDIRETADGYIVAGESNGDMWVLKLNQLGVPQWQKTYGYDGYWERARAIQQTSDDGYIVAGRLGYDMWLLKLDADGNVGTPENPIPGTWQKTYNGESGQADARAIQQTGDGGYIVTGYTTYFGAGGRDIWVLKLDQNGDPLWEKTYGGSDYDEAWSIQKTTDGGYVVAGSTESFGDGHNNFPDFWVLKLDENGQIPGCSAMGTSEAVVTPTNNIPESTTVSPVGTSLVPSGTDIDPMETEALTSLVCPLPDIDVSPLNYDFGLAVVGTPSTVMVSVSNTGYGDLTVSDISFEAGSSGDYVVTSAPQLPRVLPPVSSDPVNGTFDIEVTFTPSVAGVSEAVLEIASSDPDEGVVEVEFSGSGVAAPVIFRIRGVKEPGQIIRIVGENFGQSQGDSEVHINRRVYGPSHRKIERWTDTRIRFRLPNYKCEWFKEKDYRRRRIWVVLGVLGGVPSNVKRPWIFKPDICP